MFFLRECAGLAEKIIVRELDRRRATNNEEGQRTVAKGGDGDDASARARLRGVGGAGAAAAAGLLRTSAPAVVPCHDDGAQPHSDILQPCRQLLSSDPLAVPSLSSRPRSASSASLSTPTTLLGSSGSSTSPRPSSSPLGLPGGPPATALPSPSPTLSVSPPPFDSYSTSSSDLTSSSETEDMDEAATQQQQQQQQEAPAAAPEDDWTIVEREEDARSTPEANDLTEAEVRRRVEQVWRGLAGLGDDDAVGEQQDNRCGHTLPGPHEPPTLPDTRDAQPPFPPTPTLVAASSPLRKALTVPVTLDTALSAVVGSATFWRDVGSLVPLWSDVAVTPWTALPCGCLTRTVTFIVTMEGMRAKFVPKCAISQTHVLKLSRHHLSVRLAITSSSPDVPYGTDFSTRTRFLIRPNLPNLAQCSFGVVSYVAWVKVPFLMRSTIESSAAQDEDEFLVVLFRSVVEEVTKRGKDGATNTGGGGGGGRGAAAAAGGGGANDATATLPLGGTATRGLVDDKLSQTQRLWQAATDSSAVAAALAAVLYAVATPSSSPATDLPADAASSDVLAVLVAEQRRMASQLRLATALLVALVVLLAAQAVRRTAGAHLRS